MTLLSAFSTNRTQARDELYMGCSDTAVQKASPQFTGGLSGANRMTGAYHYLRG